jgi:membrane protein involved in colicin uptake
MNITLHIEGTKEEMADVFAVLAGKASTGKASTGEASVMLSVDGKLLAETIKPETDTAAEDKAAAAADAKAAEEAAKKAKADKAAADKAAKAAKAAEEKAAKEAAEKAAAAEAEAEADEGDSGPEIKVEELRELAKSVGKEFGNDTVRAILDKFDAASVMKLDKKHYKAVKEAFELHGQGHGPIDISEDDLPY